MFVKKALLLPGAAAMALLLGPGMAASAEWECEETDAVYASRYGDQSITLSFDGTAMSATAYMEGWIGPRMIWSVKGSYGCSQGASVCGLSFPLAGGEETLRDEVKATVAFVDPDDDGFSEIVVAPGLMQSAYYASVGGDGSGGLKLTVDERGDMITPIFGANEFRFRSCKRRIGAKSQPAATTRPTSLAGCWRCDDASCGVEPAEFTATSYVQGDTQCEFDALLPMPMADGAYVVQAHCGPSDGSSADEARFALVLDSDQRTMREVDLSKRPRLQGPGVRVWSRCEAP